MTTRTESFLIRHDVMCNGDHCPKKTSEELTSSGQFQVEDFESSGGLLYLFDDKNSKHSDKRASGNELKNVCYKVERVEVSSFESGNQRGMRNIDRDGLHLNHFDMNCNVPECRYDMIF